MVFKHSNRRHVFMSKDQTEFYFSRRRYGDWTKSCEMSPVFHIVSMSDKAVLI